ncbi:glycosyltransferase family 2 protein [Pseudomonadales bacterium]|nr:glycosyltransferase family 2 protein [Pseudomonadales bacterium]
MNLPKVSIGMPVYNGELFIGRALESLLTQTFSDFELIIADNASTDDTEEICREFAARDSRIRYVRHNENCGPFQNFQYVLEEAVGEYFMWAAADDTRDSDFLSLALLIFERDKDCGLVFCDYRQLNFETGRLVNMGVGTFNSAKSIKKYLMRLLAPSPSLIYGLHRTSTLLQIPLRNYDYFDVHLTHWYAIHSVVKIIPLPLYVAGVSGPTTPDGRRIPYSLTSERIDPSTFYREERKMLFENFRLPVALFYYCLLRYLFFRNVRNENKKIKVEKKRVTNYV